MILSHLFADTPVSNDNDESNVVQFPGKYGNYQDAEPIACIHGVYDMENKRFLHSFHGNNEGLVSLMTYLILELSRDA